MMYGQYGQKGREQAAGSSARHLWNYSYKLILINNEPYVVALNNELYVVTIGNELFVLIVTVVAIDFYTGGVLGVIKISSWVMGVAILMPWKQFCGDQLVPTYNTIYIILVLKITVTLIHEVTSNM